MALLPKTRRRRRASSRQAASLISSNGAARRLPGAVRTFVIVHRVGRASTVAVLRHLARDI